MGGLGLGLSFQGRRRRFRDWRLMTPGGSEKPRPTLGVAELIATSVSLGSLTGPLRRHVDWSGLGSV